MLIIVFLVCHHTRLLQLRAAVLKSDKVDSLLIILIMPWNETVTSPHNGVNHCPLKAAITINTPEKLVLKQQVSLILLRHKLTFTAMESTNLEEPRDSSKEPLPQRPTAGQSREYI